MTLEIVGTGLGRTGTKSMQTALNRLGFGPCHHMIEVIFKPETMPMWIEAAKGAPDWEKVFAGYRSCVDWPGVRYWRELIAYYPKAKVLHTTRDPQAWFESTQATIFNQQNLDRFATPGVPADFFASVLGDLRPHMADRDAMIDYFLRHDAEVRASVPAERLLVYEVGSGWEPLCEFLGVPVLDEPYPSENSRAEFAQRSITLTSRAGSPGQPANSSHA